MTIFEFIIVLIVGFVLGYISSGLLSANTHIEEVEKAYENGRAYERNRITQTLEENKDNNA